MDEEVFSSQVVINSMRYGIVPMQQVHQLTVGRDEIIADLMGNFERVKRREGRSLLIEGQFGSGKSHALSYAKYLGFRENFVQSNVTVDQTNLFNKLDKAFNLILERIELPDFPTIVGFERILQEISRSPKRIRLEEWCNDVGNSVYSEKKLKVGIRAYLNSLMDPNSSEDSKEIIRWLLCEKVEIRNIKKILREVLGTSFNLGTLKFVQDEIMDLVRSLGQMLVDLGYSGWLILVDEFENFFALSRGLQSRAKIFNNLNSLIAGIRNVFIVFGVTPGTLDSIHDYFLANRFKGSVSIPPFLMHQNRGAVLRVLKPLTTNDYRILSKSILRFYERAYPTARFRAEHEKFLEKFFELSESGGLPTRSVIKTIVEVLDFFSIFPKETAHLLTAEINLVARGTAREDSIKPGDHLQHEIYGVCKVLSIDSTSDGKKVINAQVLQNGEIKSFLQQFAKFRKFEMRAV